MLALSFQILCFGMPCNFFLNGQRYVPGRRNWCKQPFRDVVVKVCWDGKHSVVLELVLSLLGAFASGVKQVWIISQVSQPIPIPPPLSKEQDGWKQLDLEAVVCTFSSLMGPRRAGFTTCLAFDLLVQSCALQASYMRSRKSEVWLFFVFCGFF